LVSAAGEWVVIALNYLDRLAQEYLRVDEHGQIVGYVEFSRAIECMCIPQPIEASIDGVVITEVGEVGFLLKADNGKEIFISNIIAQRMFCTTAPTEQQVRQIIDLSIDNARIFSESYTHKDAWQLAISDAIRQVLTKPIEQAVAQDGPVYITDKDEIIRQLEGDLSQTFLALQEVTQELQKALEAQPTSEAQELSIARTIGCEKCKGCCETPDYCDRKKHRTGHIGEQLLG
jgi:hypothetical protein